MTNQPGAQPPQGSAVQSAQPHLIQPQLLPGIVIASGTDNKAPMLSLAAFEKMGKCVRGDTLVLDPRKGALVPIRKLVEELRDDSRVLTMNVASLLVETTPVKFFANPREQLFKLRTQSGFEIEATALHPFLTPEGWKALKDLDLKDDRVATVAEYPTEIFWRGSERNPAALKVLAYMIADGAMASMVFSKDEAEVREDFIEAVETLGDEVRVFSKNDGRGTAVGVSGGACRKLMEDAGLIEALAAQKALPAYVFGLKKAPLALLLSRLFTCDGSVEAAGKLSYSSTSLVLMQQLRHLLARFGVVATMRDKMLDDKLYGRELQIQSRAAVVRFVDEIGFFGEKQVKAEALRERLAVTPTAGKGDETQLWRHGSYLFDRIRSIEATVVEEVFDVEIAESHNFVANDFVIHNSTTAITTLVNYPRQGMQPLVLAWDEHGPDACIRLGYHPHVIRIRQNVGSNNIEKWRGVWRMLMMNIDAVRKTYGSVVVDCASTCASFLHEDAKNIPKNKNNPDTRAPYFELGLYFREFIGNVRDLGLPSVFLSWLAEGSIVEEGSEIPGGQKRKHTELGGPDIMGRKLRNFIAGKADHNMILEKYKSNVDPWGRPADDEGSVRVIHTKQWRNVNAGGRYSHLLPNPAPAHLGYIFSRITGEGGF